MYMIRGLSAGAMLCYAMPRNTMQCKSQPMSPSHPCRSHSHSHSHFSRLDQIRSYHPSTAQPRPTRMTKETRLATALWRREAKCECHERGLRRRELAAKPYLPPTIMWRTSRVTSVFFGEKKRKKDTKGHSSGRGDTSITCPPAWRRQPCRMKKTVFSRRDRRR